MRELLSGVSTTLWNRAVKRVPHEACGYIWLDPVEDNLTIVYETLNLASDPTKEFWLHPDEFYDYRARYPGLGIWHSHPYGRWDLSRADKKLMVETQVPMVVVAWQPYPSVTLYVIEAGQIRAEAQYGVEGVTV